MIHQKTKYKSEVGIDLLYSEVQRFIETFEKSQIDEIVQWDLMIQLKNEIY